METPAAQKPAGFTRGARAPMKVAILDDYFETLRTLSCFDNLTGHDVTVWVEHVQDDDGLAERLQNAEAINMINPEALHQRSQVEP
jgi:D-3-phosphoglycerate dehydrogenase / 2-oxoglutarate reductase